MQIPLQLKQYSTNRHPRSPAIEASLPLAHTDFVPARVDANVGTNAGVESILQSPQPFLDRFGTVC